MKNSLKTLNKISFLIDTLMTPVTFSGALWLRLVRYLELKNYPLTKRILFKIGVFPLVNHYYETQFQFEQEFEKLKTERLLKGINLNIDYQLNLLKSFNYAEELKKISKHKLDGEYYYNNGSFNTGDADYYYSLIRKNKPKKIIEVGSGFSTLLALKAIQQNNLEDSSYTELTCIEPYEMPWLNRHPITLLRKKVEDLDLSLFTQLEENDILFIDSSHIIRPEGDVTFELFKVLPELKKGVFIHFHDIFTPWHYPLDWLKNDFRFWNEQYLLEAFLSFNNAFEVTGSLAYLQRKHHELLAEKFPILNGDPKRIPGSFWIRKVV